MKWITIFLAFVALTSYAQVAENQLLTCSAICTISGVESTSTKLVLGKGSDVDKALVDLKASCDLNKTCEDQTTEISTAIGTTGNKTFDKDLACSITTDPMNLREALCFADVLQPIIECNGQSFQVSPGSYQIMSEAFNFAFSKNIEPIKRNGAQMFRVKLSARIVGSERSLEIKEAQFY